MKTGRLKYFIFLVMLNGSLLLNAQSSTGYMLYLSNYSFTPNTENSGICKIITNNTESFSLKLSGKSVDLFVLTNNRLFLSKKGLIYYQKNSKAPLSIQMIEGKKLILEKSFFLLKNDFIKNGVIAHRGAWKNKDLPQNSIASLQNAINLGCEGSEFDVHLTADEVLVVNHDPEFNGMIIEKSNFVDLKKQALKNGETLPTLEDFIKVAMQQQKTRLVCELKESIISKERSLLFAEKVLEKVNELKAQAWMVYISFDYDILKRIIEIENSSKTMYLGGDIAPDILKTDGMYGADYYYSVYQHKSEYINEAHKVGLAINAWTVNDSLIIDYLIAHNADYITTNEPEFLLKRLSKEQLDSKRLVWSDEFNYTGLPDSAKWGYQVGGHGWGNNELQYYTEADPQNVSVANGRLLITACKQPKDKKEYTSARLVSKNKGDWRYGRIEIRARLPKGRGLWPAIWMLPTDNKYGGWPASGEIDIMEHVGYSPDSVFQTIHTKDFNHMIGTQVSNGIRMSEVYDDFYVYSIDWQEDKIDFFIDNIKYLTFNNSHKSFGEWPFDQQFYLIINIAVGGGWGGKKGVDDTIFPATMEIDYVRVFQSKE